MSGETVRCSGAIVETVKVFRIFKVAFHYIPRVAMGGNAYQVKHSNFIREKSGNFPQAKAGS